LLYLTKANILFRINENFIMKNITVKSKGVFFSLILVLAYGASAQEFRPGLTLNPQVGEYLFDSERNLEDDSFLGFGLGYQFDNPWALEINYLTGETQTESTSIDVDYDQYRLDALYHLSADPGLQPYLAAGLGRMKFDSVFGDGDETQINVGGGAKYFLNDIVALRGDLRAFYGNDDSTVDFVATLGLFMHFGQARAPMAATAAPPPTQQPTQPPTQPRDSDGDGVADNADQCPDSERGARVDQRGCYVLLTETRTIQMNIRFANDSDVVEQQYRSEIQKVADFMREYPQTNVVVEGHTDDRGAADYNQQLSDRRARAVANSLINDFSIPARRVSSVGKGEAEPIADNTSAEGRASNRRVVGVVSASVETRQ
jgi:OOP family OmpA-OmpF porin